jgi:rare lipoprotein A
MQAPTRPLKYRLLVVLMTLGTFLGTPQGWAKEQGQADDKGEKVLKTDRGKASFFGTELHGEETASGETLHKEYPVAAHPSWPLGTIARITNLESGRSIKVRIIDRGPAKRARREGVIIDLSHGTAKMLGFTKDGKTDVRVEVLKWGDDERK